jgi:very-short-patch-repair endonuclease
MRGKVPNRQGVGGRNRDQNIRRLAERQHGVVSRRQLLQAQFHPDVIDRAVGAGRLAPLFRGVYAVGHTAISREGWWMAALLVCGDSAALSHRSAAALWRFAGGPVRPIELIVAGNRGRTQPGLRTHRMRLHPDEAVRFDGLRVTTPARTIADLAPRLDPRALRRLIERAQDLRRFETAAIRTHLSRHPRRPGRRLLRDLIDLHQPDAEGARSHLERLFLKAIRRARLPKPEVNVQIAGAERDFVWPEQRLVVEVDGYAYHSSRAAKQRDHRRDRALTSLGWRPVRFTYEDVTFDPDKVGRETAKLLAPATEPPAARGR